MTSIIRDIVYAGSEREGASPIAGLEAWFLLGIAGGFKYLMAPVLCKYCHSPASSSSIVNCLPQEIHPAKNPNVLIERATRLFDASIIMIEEFAEAIAGGHGGHGGHGVKPIPTVIRMSDIIPWFIPAQY
jgi:hypothetical protein